MFIPGFRSKNKIKMVIASVYYLFALVMAAAGLTYTLIILSLPFILFSAIDMIKRKTGRSKLVLAVSVLALIVSVAAFPAGGTNPNGTTGNSPSPQANASDSATPTLTPSSSEVPEADPSGTPKPEVSPVPGNNSPGPGNASPDVSGKLEVHFLDVGQADSILITQNNKSMLIDGGNNEDSQFVVNYLKEKGIAKLDYVIGTHPHEDHIGGLDAVVTNFDIGAVVMPKAETPSKTFEDFVNAIKSKSPKVIAPVPGTEYTLGDARFVILAPNSSTYEELNNYSVVVRLTYGNNSFLLTGDAEGLSENEILSKGTNIGSDVLKLGHHGSDTSTTGDFLRKVSPKYAIISVGKDNTYGHPAKGVLDLLNAAGVTTYRTDLKGTITAISDGKDISFSFGATAAPSATPKPVATPTPKPSATPKATPAPTPKPSSVPTPAGGVVIEKLDLAGELVTLRNTSSSDIVLSGWKLFSVTGEQTYYFPEGSIIKAGSRLTVASGDAPGDLKWGSRNIWNNAGDKAELYDGNGKLVSSK